jgi:hypothetical protein
MTTVGNHVINPFPSPVRGPAVDANVVRGNDNIIQTAFNSHDSDATVHVQSSTLAARPAAGVAGRTWVTNDSGTYEHWFDDGVAWQRIYGVDYERGTWTPVLSGSTSGTFNGVGEYIKLDRTVFVRMNFTNLNTANKPLGIYTIVNLPFAAASSAVSFVPLTFGRSINVVFSGPRILSPNVVTFANRIDMKECVSGGSLVDLTDSMVGAAGDNFFRIVGNYDTN